MTTLVAIWLGGFLALAAGLKAWRPEQAGAALGTYGVHGARAQRRAVWVLVSVEIALACALVAGSPWAPAVTAGLFVLFTVLTLGALAAGRRGRPCACFGSASTLSPSSPARTCALALVAGALALGWLPDGPSGYELWLTLGLSITLAAVAALALAVLALAREVGVLRLDRGARGALEIPEEGPQVGSLQRWAEGIDRGPRAAMKLAIFTSEGCPLCMQLAPAVSHLAADPLLAVGVFDEVADNAVWRQAEVPGSPYAVALSLDGVALAKGTYNSLSQLESVVVTARSRERGLSLAA